MELHFETSIYQGKQVYGFLKSVLVISDVLNKLQQHSEIPSKHTYCCTSLRYSFTNTYYLCSQHINLYVHCKCSVILSFKNGRSAHDGNKTVHVYGEIRGESLYN